MLARSVPVHSVCRDGDVIHWGEARISVLDATRIGPSRRYTVLTSSDLEVRTLTDF